MKAVSTSSSSIKKYEFNPHFHITIIHHTNSTTTDQAIVMTFRRNVVSLCTETRLQERYMLVNHQVTVDGVYCLLTSSSADGLYQ